MKKIVWIITIFMMVSAFSYTTSWARGRKHRRQRWFEFWDDNDHDRDDDDHDYDHDEHRERRDHRYRDQRFYKSIMVSADEAGEIVSFSIHDWDAGRGWKKKRKGQVTFVIPIRFRDQIIGKIIVNPDTGGILPERGEKTQRHNLRVSLDKARITVQQALLRITVGGKIRLGKRGNFWIVPLLYEGAKIGKIKVGTGSGNILPDLHMEEEVYRHRRHKSFDQRDLHE